MNTYNEEKQKGVVTLEACVCVLSFMILMLLISSLFVMFMAQNVTAHTVLQTTESLSLDSYSSTHLPSAGAGSVSEIFVAIMDFIRSLSGYSGDNPSFVGKVDLGSLNETQLSTAIKTRFVGYLTGGNEDEADEFLERINVVNGLDGLDFSSSYVKNDKLYIVLKYKLEYDFNIWNLATVDVEQKTCTQLWK